MNRARRVALALGLPLAWTAFSADSAHAQQCTTPKTWCNATDGYYASTDDKNRVTAVVEPLLRELKTCVDAAGGKHVNPAIALRWDADGNAVSVKVDVPGYDSLPCAAKVSGKLAQLKNPHETAIRCDFACEPPAAPAPAPVPVPVPVAPPPSAPPPVAAAPPPAAPPPPPVKYEKVWYGWQTLISDGIFGTLMVAGIYAGKGGLTTPGIIGFGLVPPILHWVHGNIGVGFGSLAIRIFLPLTAAGIGALGGLIGGARTTNSVNDAGDNAGDGAKIGLIVGLVGCAAIDAAGLAYSKEKIEGSALASPPAPVFHLRPSFALAPGRATAGVAGVF